MCEPYDEGYNDGLSKGLTESRHREQELEQALTSALSIIDVSNCCDSPLYRDDIDHLRGVLNGSK